MLNNNLSALIAGFQKEGKTKEEIYSTLITQGYKVDDIHDSFVVSVSPEEEKDVSSKKTINIVVTVGAVLIGSGIFSFIAANWRNMGNPLKLSVIVFFMLLTYFAGWIAKEKYTLQRTGDALILLGTIIYGAGIFLVAQMFHIRATWPEGFILWMLGVLGMAVTLNSSPLFYFSILLGFIGSCGVPFFIYTGLFDTVNTSTFLVGISFVITLLIGWKIRKKVLNEFTGFY